MEKRAKKRSLKKKAADTSKGDQDNSEEPIEVLKRITFSKHFFLFEDF